MIILLYNNNNNNNVFNNACRQALQRWWQKGTRALIQLSKTLIELVLTLILSL